MARFFVTAAAAETGFLTAEQGAAMLEQMFIPSLEMLAEWEEEGKIIGGVVAGERAGAYVVEAASSEELGQMLGTLPFWPMMNWQVRPLESILSRLETARSRVKRARAEAV